MKKNLNDYIKRKVYSNIDVVFREDQRLIQLMNLKGQQIFLDIPKAVLPNLLKFLDESLEEKNE